MPIWFHLALLAGNAFLLSCTAVIYARTRQLRQLTAMHAAFARQDRGGAAKFAAEAKAHAERLDLPVLLPFTAPRECPEHSLGVAND